MRRLLPIVGAAAALAGCNPPGGAQDASSGSSSYARVALTFTRDAAAPRFDAQGHFVRFRAADAEKVAAVLGLTDDGAIPLDSCRLVDGAGEIDRALSGGAPDVVQLLDAGRLLVKGPVDATMLQPRHYPELT